MTSAATSKWVTIPREVAKRHPLYGIGGWMILVILRCASIPFTVGPALVPLYNTVRSADQSETLFGYALAEIGVRAMLVAWAILNLFLIFARHPLFPRSYIGYLVLLVVFVLVETYATFVLRPTADQTGRDTIISVIRIVGTLIGAGAWIAYAIVSQRVNVTFLNRVRSNDPALRNAVTETF